MVNYKMNLGGVVMNENSGFWRVNDILVDWVDQNYKTIIDTDLTYYTPNVYEDPLNVAIADFLNVDKEILYTGPGTNQLIHSILNYRKWRKVFIISPEYGLYESVARQAFNEDDILIIKATTINEFIEQINELESNENDLLCFSSPRWYTGERLNKVEIDRILQIYKGTILIDEAYVDYSYHGNENLELAKNNERVILLRGFSKGWFVQGLRVGYAVTKKFDEGFRMGCIVPHSVASPSSRFIEQLLKDNEMMARFEKMRLNLIAAREYLYNNLKDIKGVTVFKSEANFFTILIEDLCLKNELLKISNIVDIHKGEKQGVKIWITNKRDAVKIVDIIRAFKH